MNALSVQGGGDWLQRISDSVGGLTPVPIVGVEATDILAELDGRELVMFVSKSSQSGNTDDALGED
jgi:hypothetical protein